MFPPSLSRARPLPQRRNRIRFTALAVSEPAFGRPLLDQNLSGPISVVRLGKPVLEHAKVIDRLPGFHRVPAAGSTDRAAEPGNRLGLREWRFRNFKRRGFRPRTALERVAHGY